MAVVTEKKTSISVLLALALAGPMPSAQALGLGHMDYDTQLGQPLRARINLIGTTGEDLGGLKARLASIEDFQRFGIARDGLQQLQIAIQTDSQGVPYIAISTNDSVNEPIVQFVLEVTSYTSRLIGEYTILLDPPVVVTRAPQREATAQAALPVPSEAAAPVRAETESRTALAAPAAYGPVTRTDTLWSIANKLRPRDVTTEQMMLGLVRENPAAFYDGNVNRLKQGSTLRAPARETLALLSPGDAAREVRRQSEQWLAYKRSLSSRPASTATAKPDTVSRLVVGAPESESSAADAGTAAPTDKNPGAGALSLTALEAISQETNELRDKVAHLEDRRREMDAAIAARDEQIAQLSRQTAPTPTVAKPEPPPSAAVLPVAADNPTAAQWFDAQDPVYYYWATGAVVGVLLLIVIFRRLRRRPDPEIRYT